MKILSAQEAAKIVVRKDTLMIGGFLGVGTPDLVLEQIVKMGTNDLTVITNDTSFKGKGVGRLIAAQLIKKLYVSHIGTNKDTQEQYINKQIEIEFIPQGTLVERIRAGGVGLGGILTPTGVGTTVEKGKKTIKFDGKTFLLETPLIANLSLIKAKRADYKGNLQYEFTARNFNPIMAFSGDIVIAEVEEIVPTGGISPDTVHTSSALIDYIVVRR